MDSCKGRRRSSNDQVCLPFNNERFPVEVLAHRADGLYDLDCKSGVVGLWVEKMGLRGTKRPINVVFMAVDMLIHVNSIPSTVCV